MMHAKRNNKEACMSGNWLQSLMARRSFLARLGAGAGVLGATGISAPLAAAQAASDAPWRPARHAQDDWYDKIPGQHRLVFDTTTPDGVALALRFANNYFTVNQSAYGLKDSDLAVLIVVRHKSTAFGYTDAMWAKYGKQISEQAEFTDPKTKEPPKINVYAAPADGSDQSGTMNALIKKGLQFAVCQTASRGIAGRIAKATGGDADAILKEIGANLIPNARFVPAGIVAVNRAQERGYSFALGV
jgi:intracellular sulfur oxidation DsrE/DsrF family protein